MAGSTSIFGRSLDEVTADNLDLTVGDQPVDPLEHARGERLGYRLRPDFPRTALWIGLVVVALVLIGIGGALAVWASHRLFIVEVLDEWGVMGIVTGGAIVLLGFFLLNAGVRRMLTSWLPEPAVEIETVELRAGRPVRVLLVQPGPVKLEELALTLMCERRVRRMTQQRVTHYDKIREEEVTKMQTIYTWHTSSHAAIPIVREQSVRVDRGARYEKQFTLLMPDDAEPTAKRENLEITWRFEVEGIPAILPDYRDHYPVIVRPA